jgi:outer membrane protein TolC
MQQLKSAAGSSPDLPALPRLLPDSLLSQRPDLRLAQTEVSTAAANLGVARAELFPKLVLSASGGFGALAVGGFSSLAESVYTLGSGLTAPIFNAGRIQAQITAADARLEQVAIHYEKTFLLALEDVENAFVAYQSSRDQHGPLLQAQLAAAQAVQSTQSLYQHGAGDYVTALEAQLNQLALNEAVLKSETAQRVALVSLYRAFGGGWETHEKPS